MNTNDKLEDFSLTSNMCDDRYTSKASLMDHMTDHTNAPHQCEVSGCKMKFRKVHNLLSHKRKEHGLELPSVDLTEECRTGRHKCQYPGCQALSFLTRAHLMFHLLDFHYGDNVSKSSPVLEQQEQRHIVSSQEIEDTSGVPAQIAPTEDQMEVEETCNDPSEDDLMKWFTATTETEEEDRNILVDAADFTNISPTLQIISVQTSEIVKQSGEGKSIQSKQRGLEKRFSCNICSYRTHHTFDLKRHMSRMHGGPNPW